VSKKPSDPLLDKIAKRKKPGRQTALAAHPRGHAIARRIDPGDSPELLSHLTADDIRDNNPMALLLAGARLNEDQTMPLAYAALQSVLDADEVKFVRDDDGQLWPFVVGDVYWRGPLRKNVESQIQEARFYPELEKIAWVSPWDK